VLVAAIGLFERQLDAGLLAAGVAVMLELGIVVAGGVFFSPVVGTPAPAGLFPGGALIPRRRARYPSVFPGQNHGAGIRGVAGVLYWILPHLDRLVITDQVVYGGNVPVAYLALAAAYAGGYAAVTLLLAVVIFQRREFI